MINFLTEAVNSVKEFVSSESLQIKQTMAELEKGLQEQEVETDNIKELSVAEPDRKRDYFPKQTNSEKKRYTFSTTFELPEEIKSGDLEYILRNLALYTHDGHISQSEVERIRYHGDALEDNGVYLIVNEEMGIMAIPGQFMASGLSFERDVA